MTRWSYAKDLIESDSEMAEQLLMLLSKSYNSPPRYLDPIIYQGRICSALSSLKCIPIGNSQLKRPNDCYFEDVPQLQVSMNFLKFSSESRRSRVNENMLKAAGVHAHLPLDNIFSNIENLKWDHVSLIKYLVKVKDELSASDVKKLKSTEMFPDIKDSGVYKLSDLYSNTINPELIRILSLRVLKWDPTVPKENSELGEFLVDLRFNYIIPWRILLKGVQDATALDRAAIFKYFFENFSAYEDYNGAKVDFAFVPVESADGSEMTTFLPNHVFLDAPLNHLGFHLIHPELKKYSQLIGIKERPSTDLIAKQVTRTKLGMKAAEEVFAYCARISNDFTREDWKLFQQSSFIPCVSAGSDKIVYKSYNQVFLPSQSKTYSDLFDEVDFGVQANSFLRSVGVVDEPRADNLIALLLEDPIKVFSQLGATKYTNLLERISNQWQTMSTKHSCLAKSFLSSRAFIGYVVQNAEEKDEDGEGEKLQYSLYGINELFLIDDIISHQLFNLPTAPSNLESFYFKLGCRWVSSVIRSEWKWTGQAKSEGSLINSTRKILMERRNLILKSLDNSDGKIVKNGLKRLEAAKLYQVDSIEICRTCTVNKATDSQQSCAFTDGATAHPSIYLAKNSEGQFDHFDLAAVIVNLLCEKKGRLQDSLLVASLLTTPIASLRAKGFQVDTKPQQEEIVLPEPPIVEKEVVEEVKSVAPPTKTTESTESSRKPSTNVPQNWGESVLGFLKKASESISSSESSLSKEKPIVSKAGDGRNEESLRNALERGIKSLKSHKSGDFEAKIPPPQIADEPAPKNETVRRELNSYCQVISSLKFIGKIGGTVEVYISETERPELVNGFFDEFKDTLMVFYELIYEELGRKVFKISSKTSSIHLFYDKESSAIAFNRNHSLFFNFAYFISNRHAEILGNSGDLKEVQRCKSFWFITFCHELAHNFVHDHDAQHEYYLSSFAETFLPDFIQQLNKN